MEKPWKVICAVDGIEDDFATLDEALKDAAEVLDCWRDHAHDDGEWDEEVEGIEIHLVTHAARITNREGDNEDDGVDYGITEILGNEIDNELFQVRREVARLREALQQIERGVMCYTNLEIRAMVKEALTDEPKPGSECPKCKIFDNCTMPSKGMWIRCKNFAESV